MDSGIKVGLSNIQISTDGKTYKKLDNEKEVVARFETNEIPKEWEKIDITKPVGITETISKKDNPGLFEFIRIQRRQGIFANYIYKRFGKIVYSEE